MSVPLIGCSNKYSCFQINKARHDGWMDAASILSKGFIFLPEAELQNF